MAHSAGSKRGPPSWVFARSKFQRNGEAQPAPSFTLPPLSEEQKVIFDKIMQPGGKNNMFVTGSAGTGKSVVLQHAIQAARALHGDAGVAVVAPTGVAACNIRGKTLHSRFSIPIESSPQWDNWIAKPGQDGESVKRGAKHLKLTDVQYKTVAQLTGLKVIFIDEISMVETVVLRTLETLACYAKKVVDREKHGYAMESEVFGGIQVVMFGDFAQLPPINGELCFKSPLWSRMNPACYQLQAIFRQNEPELINILNAVRFANFANPDIVAKIHALSRDITVPEGFVPTILCSRNDPADKINIDRYAELDLPEHTYQKRDRGDDRFVKMLDSAFLTVLDILKLKIGTQVMMTRNVNVEAGLVNGAKGVVVGFVPATDPSTLEWVYGKSRVLSGETLPPVMLPEIKFLLAGKQVVKPYDFTLRDQKDVPLATRVQLPLRYAWAITVHKSQGMTLHFVKFDVSDARTAGQVYVGMSRAATLDGLQVTNFNTRNVKVNQDVIDFYYNMFIKAQSPADERAEPA